MLIKIDGRREHSERINWHEVKQGICIGLAIGLALVLLAVLW